MELNLQTYFFNCFMLVVKGEFGASFLSLDSSLLVPSLHFAVGARSLSWVVERSKVKTFKAEVKFQVHTAK